MTQPENLILNWDAHNTASLPAFGLAFTVSDECGEEAYRGFYWREESANNPRGAHCAPQDAKRAAQDWVNREVPRMTFLIEIDEEVGIEEGVPTGHYLLSATHLPLLQEDGVHDAACLLGQLARDSALPVRFDSDKAARDYVRSNDLALHDPSDYGLV
jgi:hypothetical protein